MGAGRLTLKIDGSWEVDPQNGWEMGGGPSKWMGDGRLTLKMDGSWEVDPQNGWELGG